MHVHSVTIIAQYFVLFGRIECIRCGLLRPIFPWRGVSVSLSVTCVCSAKTGGQIGVLFGVETAVGPRNIVLNGRVYFGHLSADEMCVSICVFRERSE